MPANRVASATSTRAAVQAAVESPVEGVEVAAAPLSSMLLQLVRVHAAYATGLLAQIGLTPPQELVLLYLHEHGPSGQRDLVRYLGRDRSTVTATVQAMERNGLISRDPSPTDRRAITLALTARGAALSPQVSAIWRQLEQAAFGSLDSTERAALRRLLGTARDAIAVHRDDDSPRSEGDR